MKKFIRKTIVDIIELIFGKESHLHRIPFGPLRGRIIFSTFQISPRMYFGVHDKWLAKISREILNENDVVYDVGAHIGYTSLLFGNIIANGG